MAGSFEKVKESMEKALDVGEFKLNEKLPSEPDMAKRFGVSRITYRNVVKALEQEGRLNVRHGAGTFVVSPLPIIESSIDKLESTGQMIRTSGRKEDERREDLSIVDANLYPEVYKAFSNESVEKFVRLKRLRFADDEIVAYSINYMPYNLVATGFEDNVFSGSLFKFLDKYCDIHISCADSEFISCVDQEIINKFKIKENVGVMLLKQLHYSDDNTPVLFSYDFMRNDVFSFRIRRRK